MSYATTFQLQSLMATYSRVDKSSRPAEYAYTSAIGGAGQKDILHFIGVTKKPQLFDVITTVQQRVACFYGGFCVVPNHA